MNGDRLSPWQQLGQRLRQGTLARVMALMGRRFWPYALALVVFSATIAVCFNIVLAFLMRDVVDAAMNADRSLVIRALVLAAATLFGGGPVQMLTRYICSVCIKRTMTDLRVRLFHHATALPLSEFEAGHTGDLVSRATNDVARINAIYFDQLERIVMGSILGAVAVVAIFALDWRLGWVVLFLGVATALTNAAFARPMRQASDRLQARTGAHTERLLDLLQSVPEVKMFGLERTIHGGYSRANAAVTKAALAQGSVRAVFDAVNRVLYSVRGLGLLGLGLYLYARGELPLGSAWAILALRGNADALFAELGRFVAHVQQSLAAAARVFELLDRPLEPACYAPGAVAAAPSIGSAKLAFRQVGFRYPQAGKNNGTAEDIRREDLADALQGVTLDVPSGQIVALVGPSGSGKSTLIKLLLGFYPEQEGEILIDGQPVRGIPLQQLRERLAYVPQEAYLFDGTIEENIRMGQPTASFADIQAAAAAANAHVFILEQPEGYQTRVGERGARLSGGQCQRITIARALLKDASILLLDEATSALDSESEQLVQDALDSLMRGRTTLAIAHRLSTIEHADVIYVMDRGRVVERGSHRELVAQDGLYTRLHRLQFAEIWDR